MMSFSKMIAVGFLLFAMMAGQTAPIAAGQTPAITVPENGTPEEIVRFLFASYSDSELKAQLIKQNIYSLDLIKLFETKSLKRIFTIFDRPEVRKECGSCVDEDFIIGGQEYVSAFIKKIVVQKLLPRKIIVKVDYLIPDYKVSDTFPRTFVFLKEQGKWRIDDIYGNSPSDGLRAAYEKAIEGFDK